MDDPVIEKKCTHTHKIDILLMKITKQVNLGTIMLLINKRSKHAKIK